MLKISTELFNKVGESPLGPNADTLSRADALMKQTEDRLDQNSSWYRGRKLFQLDVHYRWSTIVFDERYDGNETRVAADVYGVTGHDTRAGDRAPDAPDLLLLTGTKKDTKTRLFDLFSPSKHIALIFTSAASVESALALIEPLKGLDVDDLRQVLILPKDSRPSSDWNFSDVEIVLDSEGHAYTGYGLKPDGVTPAVVIVRPDSMVATFALTEAGIRKYVDAVFGSA